MSYTVEGEEIDPAELRDGTWQHPKCPADPLDLQKRFGRKKTDPTELTEELGLAGASAASKNKSRPPQLPRRKPMPRLPEEDYKIVLRPKCAVNLTNIGLIALLEAIYATSKINQAQAEQADQVRVHPIKNTITISTPDRTRADAYRTLESLRCEEHNIDIPVSAYVPAPDDSIRGLVYRAYTNETDQAIHDEIANKNPQLPIVNARRLGNSKHFVITFAGRDLPSLIRYRCFTLNVYPFRERPEACFNCRKLGHRSDVCPQPRPEIPRCRRCGEEHSPPPEGEKPTCIPLCVVCHGTHPTGSRNCKRRFIQPKQNKKTTSQSDTQTTGETRRSHSRGRTQGVFRDRSESFPPLHSREIDQSTSGGNTSQQDEPAKHVAWGSGKPNLRDKTTPQVTTTLETPPEQQSRNGRTTTQTREERSGYKISQAAREEGTPTRPQQSKPQQQQDQQSALHGSTEKQLANHRRRRRGTVEEQPFAERSNMLLLAPAVSLLEEGGYVASYEEALEEAAKDSSQVYSYNILFIASAAVVLLVLVSALVCTLFRSGEQSSNALRAMVPVIVVLIIGLLGFIIYTFSSYKDPLANETAAVRNPGSGLRGPTHLQANHTSTLETLLTSSTTGRENVHTSASAKATTTPTTKTVVTTTSSATTKVATTTSTTKKKVAAAPTITTTSTTTTKPPIPPHSLVCTLGTDMNETTTLPDDGLCDYTMLEVLPVKLGGPYPKSVENFLEVASKHRRTQYGIGFDSKSIEGVKQSLVDAGAKSNLNNLYKKRIYHFGYINTDIYLFNETFMADLLGTLKTVLDLMGDKKPPDLPIYTFMASAWKALSMAQRVSADDAAKAFKDVLTPDLFISIGHYAYHDIDMKDSCRLLPATYLQPPDIGIKEQYKYTFGLLSATQHVADLDKLRSHGVGAAALSVSVGLFGRWHYVNDDQGKNAEDHRPGSLCLPTVTRRQKAAIYEVCNDPKYRILDDEKFHCKFTSDNSISRLKILVFDTTETLRYKVCSAKKNATKVKYGITAAQLEFADSSGQCKNGTFPMLRAVKQILKFFNKNYTSEADFDKCVALKT